jgi:hypothetical protein
MLAAGYPKALIPFHVPNNIPSTSTWQITIMIDTQQQYK